MPFGVTLDRTGPEDPRLLCLISELDEFLHAIDGDELHELVGPFNRLVPGTRVVVAELAGQAVGCGALRSRDSETAEIKRMFVKPEARRKKIGATVLAELENWARELGHRRAILETNSMLESAVRLYTTSGYRQIPSFPPYDVIDVSVCFAKSLVDTA